MKKEMKLLIGGIVVLVGILAYLLVPFAHTYYTVVEYSLLGVDNVFHKASVNEAPSLRDEKDIAYLTGRIKDAIQKEERGTVQTILITSIYKLR